MKEVGKRLREGMREWQVSKGLKIDKLTKDAIAEAMEIFLEAGPRSLRWSTALIEADTASRNQAIIIEFEKYKKHLDGRISAWKNWGLSSKAGATYLSPCAISTLTHTN